MTQRGPRARRSISRALALLLAGSVLALAWWGWRARPEDHELEAPLELALAADPEVAGAVLAYARALLVSGDEQPAPGRLAGLSGPRLWLCAYPGAGSPRCASGGPGAIASAVASAAGALSGGGAGEGTRLKLDWELARAEARWPAAARPHEAGTFGIVVGEAVLLPSEILERGLFGTEDEDEAPAYDTEALRALLAERGQPVGERFDFERIRTASWVESADGLPIRLYRTHPYERVPFEAQPILDRALWAADALARSVDDQGRIRYRWDVSEGREQRGYNRLRHAGSTYALIEAYERTGHPPWREAAERALRYLLSQSKTDERHGPYGGGTARYLVEGTHIKLGGAALALLALATWQSATGDDTYAAEAGQFATFLVSQQQETGEFVYFAPLDPDGEPRDDTSAYYPGEAVVALMALYEVDPDPRWLQTAERGARWLIEVRDAGKPPRRLDNDHWLSMGLRELHRHTGEPVYAEHALRIAEAVAEQSKRHEGHERYHRDYLGGYYEPPRSTPASTRAEALVAILELGVPPQDEPRVRALLQQTVQHILQSQYLPDTSYWTPRPEEVVGHVSGGIVDPDLRNDFTQHALSALLGSERLLGTPPPLTPEEIAGKLAALRSVGP